jgi:hypothetical protein
MKYGRVLRLCVAGIVCSTHGLDAQDFSRYRHFELGSDIATSRPFRPLEAVAASEVKTIHQRPAVLQDLEYRPSRWVAGSTAASNFPVEQIAFSFYNDQLFRIVVDYGHDRTEGMTGSRHDRDLGRLARGSHGRRERMAERRLASKPKPDRPSRDGETASMRWCSTKCRHMGRRTG